MESPLKVACVTYEAVRAVVRGNAGVESVKVESLGGTREWVIRLLLGEDMLTLGDVALRSSRELLQIPRLGVRDLTELTSAMRRSVEAYVGSRGDIAEYNRSQAYAYTTKAEAFPAAVMTISGVPLVLIPGVAGALDADTLSRCAEAIVATLRDPSNDRHRRALDAALVKRPPQHSLYTGW